MPSTAAKPTFPSIRVFSLIALGILAIWISYGCNHLLNDDPSGESNSTSSALDLLNERANDAKIRIQSGWSFSDYAVDKLPEVIAGGQWSVSPNFLYCNTELFDCEEVDFAAPSKGIKSEWVLSYYKRTAKYCCTRILTDSTNILFEQKETQASGITSGKSDDSVATSNANKEARSEPSDAIAIIRNDYAINVDDFPAHTGRPLPSDGQWASRVVTSGSVEPYICGHDGTMCSEVSYRVESLGIICTWVVAQSRGSKTAVFGLNPSARAYFAHIRDSQ